MFGKSRGSLEVVCSKEFEHALSLELKSHMGKSELEDNYGHELHDLCLLLEWGSRNKNGLTDWGFDKKGARNEQENDLILRYNLIHKKNGELISPAYGFAEHAGMMLLGKDKDNLRWRIKLYKSGTIEPSKLDEIVNPAAKERAGIITKYIIGVFNNYSRPKIS